MCASWHGKHEAERFLHDGDVAHFYKCRWDPTLFAMHDLADKAGDTQFVCLPFLTPNFRLHTLQLHFLVQAAEVPGFAKNLSSGLTKMSNRGTILPFARASSHSKKLSPHDARIWQRWNLTT